MGTWFFVLRSWLLWVLVSSLLQTNVVCEEPRTKNEELGTFPFRPKPGEFPPLEKAHSYRGELTFVDHANRRGTIRIVGNGKFRFTGPSPFAMLPYGIVCYQGAPADLRDVPLGTMLHVHAFLPPDPQISSVPVLPLDNRTKKLGNAGTGTLPAENHVLLMEDEPSYCLRNGFDWKLKEVEIQNNQGMLVASRQSKVGDDLHEETFTFDAATRIWRGREFLAVRDLVADGVWPTSGKKSLNGKSVQLGITWKPTPGGVFTRFHISDIWLDDAAMQRAANIQTETHKAFIKSRWMPAWIDKVEYGKFGRATVTVTMFGGMDESLYVDFKKGSRAMLAASENTLKHWASGTAGTVQMAAKGPILDVTKVKGPISLGSSGIQIRFEADLITEGFRPTKVVRIRPNHWPHVEVPREEYLHDAWTTHEDRFPTPDIFRIYQR